MVEYKLRPQKSGNVFAAKLSKGTSFIEMEAHTSILRKYDWDAHLKVSYKNNQLMLNQKMLTHVLRFQISTSHQRYKTFLADVSSESAANGVTVLVRAETPFEHLENPQFGISI